MTKLIIIDGLPVEVTRKRIKKMYLRVKGPDGKVTISAPYLVTDRQIIEFVRSRMDWIDNTVATVRNRAASEQDRKTDTQKKQDREYLRRRISERLPVIEERTGLSCSGWSIRDMHTRWGSCNTGTHHINFSLMLAERSDVELDYVILHELVHTVVPNHGPDFYALMDRFMPGWKTIRKGMKY